MTTTPENLAMERKMRQVLPIPPELAERAEGDRKRLCTSLVWYGTTDTESAALEALGYAANLVSGGGRRPYNKELLGAIGDFAANILGRYGVVAGDSIAKEICLTCDYESANDLMNS